MRCEISNFAALVLNINFSLILSKNYFVFTKKLTFNKLNPRAMSKFGELIDLKIPVLLNFYTEWDEECKAMHPILKDVAAALGDQANGPQKITLSPPM